MKFHTKSFFLVGDMDDYIRLTNVPKTGQKVGFPKSSHIYHSHIPALSQIDWYKLHSHNAYYTTEVTALCLQGLKAAEISPSAKHNSTIERSMGLISLLLDLSSSQDVPFAAAT